MSKIKDCQSSMQTDISKNLIWFLISISILIRRLKIAPVYEKHYLNNTPISRFTEQMISVLLHLLCVIIYWFNSICFLFINEFYLPVWKRGSSHRLENTFLAPTTFWLKSCFLSSSKQVCAYRSMQCIPLLKVLQGKIKHICSKIDFET